MPSRTGVVHEATGPGAPSTPTRQTRHAPNGAWRSSKQSVGIHGAGDARGLQHGRARPRPRPRCRRSSSVGIRSAPARRGSARSGCGSARACRRRARTGCRASSVSSRSSSARAIDRRGRSRTSRARAAGRSGTGSTCRSSRRRRSAAGAWRTPRMSVSSSKATIPPWPTMQPSAASSSKSKGVSSSEPGRMPASGPPICSALIARPSTQAAGDLLAELAHRHAERHLVHAGVREALVEADQLGARRRAVRAERRVGLGAVRGDERRRCRASRRC